MKKVMSLMLVFSVVFMGFASTLAQSVGLATTYAAEFALSNELSEGELAEVDGEGVIGAIAGGAVGAVAGAVVGAVGVGVIAARGGSSKKQGEFLGGAISGGLGAGATAGGFATGPF